jgi:hypothetical protein
MPAIKVVKHKAVKVGIVKPVEPVSGAWMLNAYCDCGCRLKTDGKLVWCSKPACKFVNTKQYFQEWWRYDSTTLRFVKLFLNYF